MALVKLVLQGPYRSSRCSPQMLLGSINRSAFVPRCFQLPHNIRPQCLHTTTVTVPSSLHLSKLFGFFLRYSPKRCIHQTVARQTRLLFEEEGKILKDTPVFSYSNDRLFRMMTWFGIVQFIFWCNLAMFTYGTFKDFNENDPRYDMNSRSGQILLILSKYSYKMAAMCIILGHTILFFTMVYPQRSVRNLVLLRGGLNVKLVTYKHFGKTDSSVVPLDNLSFSQARVGKSSHVPMKIKGRWFNYLLHKDYGTFHNTDVYDHIVGLQRTLKK